jgi:hypothetical protein
MPNGRSGGFVIETEDLKELVKAIPDATVIGKIVVHSSQPRPADAAEVARFLETCANDRVAVEEQDKKLYIIHLRNEPELMWLVVSSEAPIFLDLRQRHARWATEHPDWKGWHAF